MARRSTHQVTVREGTGEKYWYTLAGHAAGTILAAAYIAWVLSGSPNSSVAGMFSGVIMLGLAVVSLSIYPALFKDSAYLRGTRARWKPEWWKYMAGGLGAPLVVYFAGKAAIWGADVAFAFAVFAFVASSFAVSVSYLYNRHQYVGVP
ncbi:hypothetical protein [Haloarchaeobius sp. DFWS5]|uniref:hypothetical protein n=1 Tax=Haloarchaeobius sp. DFWS5 TaxID=3446114 RepID=UPI003EB75E77